MPKADGGSTKAIANAIKAKGECNVLLAGVENDSYFSSSTECPGLGRLRWYCQICEKQCRDENGFQASPRSSCTLYIELHEIKCADTGIGAL